METDVMLRDVVDQLQEVGDNIVAGVVENKLILVIDTEQEIGLRSTGKMMGVASTGGFTRLPGGLSGIIYIGKKEKKP
jgi:hypothetical protein